MTECGQDVQYFCYPVFLAALLKGRFSCRIQPQAVVSLVKASRCRVGRSQQQFQAISSNNPQGSSLTAFRLGNNSRVTLGVMVSVLPVAEQGVDQCFQETQAQKTVAFQAHDIHHGSSAHIRHSPARK